jgi:hypothetical protein
MIAWALTTADRGPGRNYLAETIRALAAQGITPHVFATSPDVRWLADLRPELPCLHVPLRRLTRIENGAALMLATYGEAEWLVHLEDDVAPCADVAGSVTRWLERHAREDRRVVLCWSAEPYAAAPVADHPVTQPFGAVAFAIRTRDARRFGTWAQRHAATWRSGSRRRRGFDKMLACWHQAAYPAIPMVSATVPSLFQHLGRESSLRHLAPASRWQESPTYTGAAYA